MDLYTAKIRLIDSLSQDITDKRVLNAMMHVPRERFIPENLYDFAYEDRPLSIGYGQTISQPFIVALMTQALNLNGTEIVLEIGTGSGYQTAILAEIAKWVVSVERIPQLVERAKNVLSKLGYNNIEIHLAKQTLGWEDKKPYDAIIVTAASPNVPDVLLDQLIKGGRLVIPVGSRWEQELLKVTKTNGKTKAEHLGYCRFVPLIGEGAWKE